MIDRDADTFSCIECNKTSCPKCDSQPAHSGKTCEQAAIDHQKLLALEGQESDAITGESTNIVKCPKCGSYCELYDGCHFMTCLSSFCLKRTHFCNLCGKQLTDKGHWGHYSLKGPYGDSCNTLDNIEDADGVSKKGTEMPSRIALHLKKKLEKKVAEEMVEAEDRRHDSFEKSNDDKEEEKFDDMVPDFLQDHDALHDNIQRLSTIREQFQKITKMERQATLKNNNW